MTREMGLWIDHRKAVIAVIVDKHVALRQLASNMEKHVRYSGAAQEDSAEREDRRQSTSLSWRARGVDSSQLHTVD
jgi:hypothetical protein